MRCQHGFEGCESTSSTHLHITCIRPHAEWISVKDRIPPKDQEVLFWDGEDIFVEYWDTRVDSFFGSAKHHPGVSHWMPLPEPPE